MSCQRKMENRAVSENVSRFGIRHCQCVLLFFGLAVGYALRVNLSMAIVIMMDKNLVNGDFKVFDWSEGIKSYVLSSFFWGYLLTQVPGGPLTRRFGAKVLFFWAILINSILACVTPMLVAWGDWPWLCAVRVLQGLFQGVLFPCTHAMLSKWAPIEERASLCTLSYAGTLFGAAFMFAISGHLAAYALHWSSIFYMSGALGFIWLPFWQYWASNEPESYNGISTNEKLLIKCSTKRSSTNSTLNESNNELRTPWLAIIKSRPVWILTIVHSAHSWCFVTLLTQLPSYLHCVFNFDIKQNALLTSLPYFAMLILSLFFSYLANVFEKKKIFSVAWSRRIFNTIGQWMPAACLFIMISLSTLYLRFVITLLVIAVALNAASFSGFQVNHIDLSSNYASVLMGITNCAANIMSTIAPLCVGVIVTNEKDVNQWHYVFMLTATIYGVGNALFITLGSFETQPWNNYDQHKSKSQESEVEEHELPALRQATDL